MIFPEQSALLSRPQSERLVCDTTHTDSGQAEHRALLSNHRLYIYSNTTFPPLYGIYSLLRAGVIS
jgi:hypothetical protein